MRIEVAVYGALIAFAVGLFLCPLLIPFLTRLKFGQNIRREGPQSHLKKAGTPTMGGIVIVLSFLAGAFFVHRNEFQTPESLAVILVTLGFGLVGFCDDYIKVVKKRNLGLRAWQKIALQLLITAFFVWYILTNPSDYFGLSQNQIVVPFSKTPLDLGILYIPVVLFVMVGGVNAVNLTDGLDGLNAGVTLLVSVFFVFLAYTLNSPAMPLAGAAAGSLLAFLLFNSYPAKVFMGDTGSLALGGFVTSTAVLLKAPLFLAIIGIIYVAEAVSVIIQVSYFKATHGKRVFKMTPIHHHFELSGYAETKVVSMFYIITAIAVLLAFLGINAALGR
ncbi:phospho-N-acetylmuramoyl-pentapeptide-transferase [Clostridia bacterium]|nr:phospho-N-acetylmuramoyl-pentapeptide-transferase [Clostridia bacterium]